MAHRLVAAALLVASGVVGCPGGVAAQRPSILAPSFEDVERDWRAVWDRLQQGDVEGARRYVHSSRQAVFPWRKTVEELQDMARQMAACRLEPNPVIVSFEELMYPVRCQHAGETAETFVGVRRDADGLWRFVTL